MTTDHEEIRLWIQTHHGAPARFTPPAHTHTGEQLCIDFLGVRRPGLEHLGWRDWFTAFDAHLLTLSYADTSRPEFPETWELVHRPRTH